MGFPLIKLQVGWYDDNGNWVRGKHCFIVCPPDVCECDPPMGKYYDPAHNKRIKEGTNDKT